jgi:transcriptional regulator with XRE-family HTH domain
MIGVHNSHISKWEVAEYAPDGDHIQKLSVALGVPTSEFFLETQYADYFPPGRTEQVAVTYLTDRESRLGYLTAIRHYLHHQLSIVNDEISLLEQGL